MSRRRSPSYKPARGHCVTIVVKGKTHDEAARILDALIAATMATADDFTVRSTIPDAVIQQFP